MTPLLGGLIEVGLKLIDRVLPDPQKKAEAQLRLLELQQSGELKQLEADLQLSLAQIEVNKVEAAAPDLFRAGWRPLCGYVCVAGLAYQFLIQPLLSWASGINTWPVPPEIDMGDLIVLLGGMLGLGGLRTTEKLKGVAK